jgi:hypothetical protein
MRDLPDRLRLLRMKTFFVLCLPFAYAIIRLEYLSRYYGPFMCDERLQGAMMILIFGIPFTAIALSLLYDRLKYGPHTWPWQILRITPEFVRKVTPIPPDVIRYPIIGVVATILVECFGGLVCWLR